MIINLCGGSGGGSSAPIKLQGLIARENGTYTPDEGYDGYSEVLVEVTEPTEVFVVPDGIKFSNSTFTEIPDYLDFSECSDLSYVFSSCDNLNNINLVNIKATNMSHLFSNNTSLTNIISLNTSNATDIGNCFATCSSLVTIPLLDTHNVIKMDYLFTQNKKLQSIPQLVTTNLEDASYMFYYCEKLESVPLLDFGSVRNANRIFGYCNSLTELGGLQNFKPSVSYGFFENAPNLTVDSLMNVINNLYDWSGNTNGYASLNNGKRVYFSTSHYLKFGQTNLDKLTPEQIAVATAKGWTLTA